MVVSNTNKRKELTDDEMLALLQDYIAQSTNFKLPLRATSTTAGKYGVSSRTAYRIWKTGVLSYGGVSRVRAVVRIEKELRETINKCGNGERAPKRSPIPNRRTLSSASAATSIPKTTMWHMLQRGIVSRHVNSIKPLLTRKNKFERLRWCLLFMHPQTWCFCRCTRTCIPTKIGSMFLRTPRRSTWRMMRNRQKIL